MRTELPEGSERYFVPGLERGLLLLSQFSRKDCALTAPELAKRLKLPRTTVFRLLVTLEALGFVRRDGNEYRLGMSVLRMGFEYLASLELTELGQPLLAKLCNETGFTCTLVVRDGRSIIYVAKVSPPNIIGSSVSLGTRLPAHSTVLGRVLLADMELGELAELYPEPRLEQFSLATPRCASELHSLIEKDRQRGYAFSEGFYEPSVSTLALPIYGAGGDIVAAMGVCMSHSKLEMHGLDKLVRKLRRSASDLSHLLGYRSRPVAYMHDGPYAAGMY